MRVSDRVGAFYGDDFRVFAALSFRHYGSSRKVHFFALMCKSSFIAPKSAASLFYDCWCVVGRPLFGMSPLLRPIIRMLAIWFAIGRGRVGEFRCNLRRGTPLCDVTFWASILGRLEFRFRPNPPSPRGRYLALNSCWWIARSESGGETSGRQDTFVTPSRIRLLSIRIPLFPMRSHGDLLPTSGATGG